MAPSFTRTLVASFVGLAAIPATAIASATGGLAALEDPTIASVRCVPTAIAPCQNPTVLARGSRVEIRGSALDDVRSITFRGRAGRRDDVTVRPRHVRPTHVEANVPSRARTGRIEIRAVGGARAVSRSAIRVSPPVALAPVAALGGDAMFPIRGAHDLGQSATNNFGGARNHKGQDLFADCGTPLVVAEGGTVKFAKTDARAGNYAVITGAVTGRDYVYMHMRSPAVVAKGQAVTTGQSLGEVGDTGNASGCHLHFELWSAPGWYEGGSPADPLPELRAWDARDGAHAH